MATVTLTPTPLVGAPSVTFKTLDSQYNPFFEDDYAHKKLLSVKYKGIGSNFLLNAKGTLTLEDMEDFKSTGEVKIITKFTDKLVLESRFDNKGIIRLWGALGQYDFGIKRPVSLWAKLKTSSDFEGFSSFLQASVNFDRCTFNTRIDRKAEGDMYLNSKFYTTYKNFHFTFVDKLSLADFSLKTYNALLAYRENKYDIVLAHLSQDNSCVELGELSASGYYRHDQHTGGLKLNYRPNAAEKSKKFSAVLGGIFKLNKNTVLKTKIDHKGYFSTALKCKINNNLTATVGAATSLKNPKLIDKSGNLPFGFQFEFNYQSVIKGRNTQTLYYDQSKANQKLCEGSFGERDINIHIDYAHITYISGVQFIQQYYNFIIES